MDLCNFGLLACSTDKTIFAGTLLPWFEMLGIAAIIFVAVEFAESSKTRLYLFQLSSLKTLTIWAVFISIILVVISNIIQLIPKEKVPLISYPASYEFLALILLSVILLFLCWFVYNPYFFRPRLSLSMMKKLSSQVVLKSDDENLSSILHLLLAKDFLQASYLEQIIKHASSFDHSIHHKSADFHHDSPEIVQLARQFIDACLSKEEMCILIAINHFGFIREIIILTEKYDLYDSGVGNLFFSNLTYKLLSTNGSLLDREKMSGGYEMIYRPVSNLLFSSDYLMRNYYLLPMNLGNESAKTISNITYCLRVAIKNYYSQKHYTYSQFLNNSIVSLANAADHFTVQLSESDTNSGRFRVVPELTAIGDFFRDIEFLMIGNNDKSIPPLFPSFETNVTKGSVAESIALGTFELLCAFSWIKNQDDEIRMVVLNSVMWLMFDITEKPKIILNIQKRLLALIVERVEENINGNYPSLLRLLINIYGIGDSKRGKGMIYNYFQSILKEKISKNIILNSSFRERHLPNQFNVSDKAIFNSKGRQVFVIDKKTR